MVIHGGAGTILRSRMTPAVEKAYPLTMSFCLDCHRSPEQFLRPVEEVTNMAWKPEGNAADKPSIPVWPDGWQLGKPDLVVQMTEPYTLAATGTDVLRNFVVPTRAERSQSRRSPWR